MAELKALYASAVYKLALDGGMVDKTYEQALYVRDLMKDTDVRRVLIHPHITDAEKREFFGQAFGAYRDSDVFSLLLLVIDKNRESFFMPAIKSLIELIERHQKKATAGVISAVEFTAGQAEALREILSKKLDKHVEINVKVDPSIIGGPYINVDGYFIDQTIKRRLRDLAAEMKVGCGA